MGRRRSAGRRARDVAPPMPVSRRIEVGPDGHDYEVRPVPGVRAVKTYRCPGCDHEIRSGTAHVVVWRAEGGATGADDRRHWHTPHKADS